MLRWKSALIVVLALATAACSPAGDASLPTTSLERGDPAAEDIAAPEFPAGLDWLNTDRPISMDQLRGKVVLLDFWTYGCINCIHIIPDLERLEEEFAEQLVVIGVHSAKFDEESGTDNIRQIIVRYEIEHPVVNDPDFEVWNAWGARAWPTVFVVDPAGRVIGLHAGEGVYDVVQPVIAQLVEEHEAVIDRTPLNLTLESDSRPSTVLSYPGKVLADEPADRLYIADTNHHRVLAVRLSDGQILAAFGSGVAGLVDGVGRQAEFHAPQGLALSEDGDFLLVADTDNHAIRRIDLSSALVTTVAGTGNQAAYPPAGGPAAATNLSSPWDIAWSPDGSFFVAMAGTHQIWRYDPGSESITPIIGSAREGTINTKMALSELAQPSGLAVDDEGRVYFADSESSAIRVADPAADSVELVAGGQASLFEFGDRDGIGDQARLQHPLGVAITGGYVWVADTYNSKIKRIDPDTGAIETFAGSGAGWADGHQPRFYEPGGLSAGGGVVYVADTNNHSIRVVDISNGVTTTLVLKGAAEFLPAADEARFAGTVVELEERSIGVGDLDVVVNVGLPIGYKVNPDAPSRIEFSIDGAAAFIDAPGVVVNPSFPLTIPAVASADTTELVGDVSVVYCETERESICLIEQLRFLVPVAVTAGGASIIELEYQVDLPGL